MVVKPRLGGRAPGLRRVFVCEMVCHVHRTSRLTVKGCASKVGGGVGLGWVGCVMGKINDFVSDFFFRGGETRRPSPSLPADSPQRDHTDPPPDLLCVFLRPSALQSLSAAS